jgi:isoquinoline 1-oxidoreductase
MRRREFLKATAAAGVGLTLHFGIPLGRAARGVEAASAFDPNTTLTITPDGIITVHITKAEMGQGVGTALSQIVAEELEADWKDVRIDYPINDPKYGPMGTGGSRSVNTGFDTLSRAGAAARIMLIEAAAKHWGVPPDECRAEWSIVRHLPTGRQLSYGAIVARVPITATMSPDDLKKITLKKPGEYKVIGHWLPRLDIPEKTNGRARYGIDMFLPGMLYAKVAYPPTREGARHTAVDDSLAKRVKGYVKTVVTPDVVAVVADSYEVAVKARDALKVAWDSGPKANVSTASILQDYERKAQTDPGKPFVQIGNMPGAMGEAAKKYTATYRTDFLAHAQMEPMNCLARYANGEYDFYTGTQLQTRIAGVLSKKLDVPPTSIRFHQQYLGGGFGRRLEEDIVLEAALIAREAGRPIKLIRSREEDLRRGYYRSLTLQTLAAGLDGSGRITAWEHAVVTAYPRARWGLLDATGIDPFSMNGSDHVYDIPNQLVRAIHAEHGISVGYWRSVAPSYTFFALESFLDELANLQKVDPVQLRLGMLSKQPRLANVVKLAADRAGWGSPLPSNVGRGIACASAQEQKTAT